MSQAPVMSYWLSTKTVPEQPNRAWKSTHLCFMRPNAVNVVADERDQTCIELQGFPQTMGSSVEHHWLPSAWGEKRTKKTTPECSGFCLVIFFFKAENSPFFLLGVPVPEDLTCLEILKNSFSAQGTSCHRSGREAAHRELCYVGLPPRLTVPTCHGNPSPNQGNQQVFRRTFWVPWMKL